ncbi:MAG: phosphatidylglycerol lysyltransferase domain-containing protein [Bacteroidales bacterium]|jgi:hypothetical protein|nr:phosphatidylglycerol lysyltransferase domain-containing protein [Bacteroidales bacterium]
MLQFRKAELSDKLLLDSFFSKEDLRLLNYTFQILFVYRNVYNYQFAIHKELLFIKTFFKGYHMMFFPLGEGDLKEAVQLMLDYGKENGFETHCYQITPERIQKLGQTFPDKFEFTAIRDRFEYIYLTERLATLKGRSLQSKRNNVNYLSKNYQWSYEPITPENIEECRAVEKAWNEAQGTTPGSFLDLESQAVEQCFLHYKEMDVDGGAIRLDGKIAAFSFGCRLNSDTYLVLFEKAYPNIRGIYSVMNQQFVLHNAMSYKYVNREEDCGEEGLRIAKMQYHPDILQEIYCAKLKK